MPKQMESGWLLEFLPDAALILMLSQTLICIYSIVVIIRSWEHIRLQAEEQILLLFALSMLVLPASALIGISCHFASNSVAAGVGAALSFSVASLAFLLNRA